MVSASRPPPSAFLRRCREMLSARPEGKGVVPTLTPTATPTAAPAAAQPLEAPAGPALIGKSVVVKGPIHSGEDLYIDGQVEGQLEAPDHRLTISLHGKVQADIKAREVLIAGVVHGNVEAAEKVVMHKEAKVTGDIRTARIAIEDGAYFKGTIDIHQAPPSRVATPFAPQTPKQSAQA